jgi:DNA repair protein RecO (recombination protein O)
MDSHMMKILPCKETYFTGFSIKKAEFGPLPVTLSVQLHKTKGIVLRTIKYGETSLIATIYTELFGIQSYLVNGVRVSSSKGHGKANLFQPAAILDLVIYHNELKNLQRIREFRWGVLYQDIYFDVLKNAVALFMVELLQKCLKQPEPNPALFYFVEDAFLHLDKSEARVLANYPLFFILHLAGFFGFRIEDVYSESNSVLDLREGLFVAEPPSHSHFLEGTFSYITSQLLRVRQPDELKGLPLNQETRRILLQAYEGFYTFHVPDFGIMRTTSVMQTILNP